jgi:hypothetical protein
MTIGLCFSATDARMSFGPRVFEGVIAGFGSAAIYSVYYLICDVIGHLPDKPSSESLAAFEGLTGTLILGLIVIFVRPGPDWTESVVQPVTKAKGPYMQLATGMVTIAVCNFVHQLSFFYITKHSGCVEAGVNKAVQTICVFVLGSVCFCEEQPSQCLTRGKVMSLLTVLAAVLMYAHATNLTRGSSGPGRNSDESISHEDTEHILQDIGAGVLRQRALERSSILSIPSEPVPASCPASC